MVTLETGATSISRRKPNSLSQTTDMVENTEEVAEAITEKPSKPEVTAADTDIKDEPVVAEETKPTEESEPETETVVPEQPGDEETV